MTQIAEQPEPLIAQPASELRGARAVAVQRFVSENQLMSTNYLELLKHSYEVEKKLAGCPPESPLEYLGESIFNFTTYDGEMSVLFARKAIEVCDAINNRKTFDYIKDAENYRWFLLMCNTTFFADKLNWGTSIRGAWWDSKITFQSCGLWDGDEQLADDMEFTSDEWERFTRAVADFANASRQESPEAETQLPK